jgi:uncharacterized membrane protein YkgB
MTKLVDVIEPESNTRKDAGFRIRVVGALVLRYGLVLVIGWIGLMKFTGYQAKGIEPLVAHSPFMGWMYSFLSVQTFSDALGVVEVTIANLIGLRHWSAKASALGSAAAVIMFLIADVPFPYYPPICWSLITDYFAQTPHQSLLTNHQSLLTL